MAILFRREGNIVIPTAETLMVYPFSEIWERDSSDKKHHALQEFAYIEFMTSQLNENPFRDYPPARKAAMIIKSVFLDRADEWAPDSLVRDGITFLKHFQSEGSDDYDFLMSALRARDKLKDFLDDFNPDERTNEGKGSLLLKPKDITSALMDIERVTVSIMSTRKKVAEQVTDAVKVKGQKEVSPFANPDSLKGL